MPTLAIPTGVGLKTPLALAHIAGVMLWPNDHEARASFVAHAEAVQLTDNVRSSAEAGENVTLSASGLLLVMERLTDGPGRSEILAQGKTRFQYGMASGSVLYELHAHEQGHRNHGGVTSVKHAIAERLKISKSGMENNWKTFKSTSHLWAAFVSLCWTVVRDDMDDDYIFRNISFPYRDYAADVFLSISEDYRRFGEEFVPRQSGKGALLQPGEAWQIHTRHPLPAVVFQIKDKAL